MFKNKEEKLTKIKKMIKYLNELIENKDICFFAIEGIEHFISQSNKVIVEDNYFYGVDNYNNYSFKLKISNSLIIMEETTFHGNLNTIYNIKFIDEKTIMTITKINSKCVTEHSREITSTEISENVKLYIDNLLRYEDNTVFSVDYNDDESYEINSKELYVNNNKSAVCSKKVEKIFSSANSKRLYISENSFCESNNYKSVFFNDRKNNTPNIIINGFDNSSKEEFDNIKITQNRTTRIVEENRNLELIDSNEHVILNKPKTKIMKKIFEFIKD